MTNKYHIDVKKIANDILKKYISIRTKEKSDWESEFDKWLKTSHKSKEDYWK